MRKANPFDVKPNKFFSKPPEKDVRPPVKDADIQNAILLGFKHRGLSNKLIQTEMKKGYIATARILEVLTEKKYIGKPRRLIRKNMRMMKIRPAKFRELFPDAPQTFPEEQA